MAIVNIKTGKQFDGTSAREQMTRREFGKGLAAIIGAGVAPSIALGTVSLAGSANASVRGMMRNVGARLNMMTNVIKDWWTPLLTATWPNNEAFEEVESDTENYNDIYATYPLAS